MTHELEWRETLGRNGLMPSKDAIVIADYGNISTFIDDGNDASASRELIGFEPIVCPLVGSSVPDISKVGEALERIKKHWKLERERCVAPLLKCPSPEPSLLIHSNHFQVP